MRISDWSSDVCSSDLRERRRMNLERPLQEQKAMTDAKERAFSDIVPIVEPRPKPRNIRLPEIRSPAYSLHQLAGLVYRLGAFVDTVKTTCGTPRLVSCDTVQTINAMPPTNPTN